jgi:hypothetical protein
VAKTQLERLIADAVHRVWRSYVKHFSEKAKGGSPAMWLGIFDGLLKWQDGVSKGGPSTILPGTIFRTPPPWHFDFRS